MIHCLSSYFVKQTKFVYFQTYDDFNEVYEFMDHISNTYGISIQKLPVSTYKEGTRLLVENYGIKAIIMGVRNTDPYVNTSSGPY